MGGSRCRSSSTSLRFSCSAGHACWKPLLTTPSGNGLKNELRKAYTELKQNQEEIQAAYAEIAANEQVLLNDYGKLVQSERRLRESGEQLRDPVRVSQRCHFPVCGLGFLYRCNKKTLEVFGCTDESQIIRPFPGGLLAGIRAGNGSRSDGSHAGARPEGAAGFRYHVRLGAFAQGRDAFLRGYLA